MSPEEHRRRRRALMDRVGADGVVVVASAREVIRNRDTHYPFRQHSDFLYLTGFPEPDAVLVLLPGRPEGEYVVFCRSRDPEREIWDGRRAGPEGAVSVYGADQAHSIDQLDVLMPGLLAGRRTLHAFTGVDSGFDARLLGWTRQVRERVRSGVVAPERLEALESSLHAMRLIKSPAEIEQMQRSADIAAHAHCEAMRATRPGLHEYSIEAGFHAVFKAHGGEHAYPPIVAAGENACVLHYVTNDGPLRDGDLLLIDAGCELDGYASDITRTFPVSGRFSGEQRALYQVVLEAQAQAIAEVRPGAGWNAGHEAAVKVLCRGLVDLGLLRGEVDGLIEREAYRPFYMHRTGHWLGMDVHDVGDYKCDGEWRALAPGMVLTVEPGLYVSASLDGVDPRWHGIGIRIEDDVLVTDAGSRVLTGGVPKRIDAIEALMAS
jgi:Xaa-Pro aminopeptidase